MIFHSDMTTINICMTVFWFMLIYFRKRWREKVWYLFSQENTLNVRIILVIACAMMHVARRLGRTRTTFHRHLPGEPGKVFGGLSFPWQLLGRYIFCFILRQGYNSRIASCSGMNIRALNKYNLILVVSKTRFALTKLEASGFWIPLRRSNFHHQSTLSKTRPC